MSIERETSPDEEGDVKTTARDLEGKILERGLGRLTREILSVRREEIRLLPAAGGVAREGEVGLGATKIGGRPDLPEDAAWPVGSGEEGIRPPDAPPRAGRPLSFLGQVNLAEAAAEARAGLLPARGVLYFFYDALAQPWGFDPRDGGGWAVLYAGPSEDGTTVPLVRREAPAGLDARAVFRGRGAALSAGYSLPDAEHEEVAAWGLDEEELGDYRELVADLEEAWAVDAPLHKMLGHASALQGDHMAFQCQMASAGLYLGGSGGPAPDPVAVARLAEGAGEWRLLLQLDSDPWSGMEWGDAGTLYFWAREGAVRAREFGRAWVVLQAH